jgi:hypothetical protein
MTARDRLDEFERRGYPREVLAALRAVLDLHHKSKESWPFCADLCGACDEKWPCATVQAIEEHIK